MSFVRDHYESYDAPRLVVRLLHDAGGTPYLLLHGPEPDTRWEAFCEAVREVVERFGVTRVVGMGAVPMAVPHTRPIAVTEHANNVELIAGDSRWRGELRIPSSAQALLEVRLGEWGHDALGYVAHIPHYLAQLEYPARFRRAPRARRARRPADHRPVRAARGGRRARGRGHPLPGRQRGGQRGRRRSGAAVRRVHPVRGERQQPAERATSRCRPVRRSASSSSSSSPDSTGPTAGRTTQRQLIGDH